MEADWKKFRTMVPQLRERYLARVNGEIAAILRDPQKNETERFWDAFEKMGKEARTLGECLDGHSRSKMWLYMMLMRKVDMLRPEDIAQFSPELQKELQPDLFR